MNTRRENRPELRLFGRSFFALVRASCEERAVESRKEWPGGAQQEVEEKHAEKPECIEFVTNSMFLAECFEHLMQAADESLHCVTGSIVNGSCFLERLVPLELAYQGVAGAKALDVSLAEQLARVHEFGLRPLAYFHSHPGKGSGATYPSRTDLATQREIEKSGAKMVGAIFSRDGYVRFYAEGFAFRVTVVGSKIRQVGNNVWKLEIQ